MKAEIQSAIEAFLRAEEASQVRFLAELVRLPSDNPPGDCAAHASCTASMLEAMGFAIEQHPVPDDVARAYGLTSVINLVARERFGDGPTVALNAHGDVVPPGLGWTHDPYGAEVVDGVMYGRGVAVSKSDFATYAYALAALKASGAKLAGAVELHFTYDEETGGGAGPRWLLEQRIVRPDYAISAGFAYAITTAHNGCLHLEVEVIGRSAHAARPETGIDALEAAAGVLADLYAIRKTYVQAKSRISGIDHPTLVVGLVEGGINTNVVPDRVTLRLDRRIIPEENAEEAASALERQILESAAKWPGIACNVRRILLAVPFVPIAGQEKLVAAIARYGTPIMGEPVEAQGVPIYTDARLYSTAGVPTVSYGAGPRTLLEANGHRADEKLRLDDLHKATRVVALAVGDLLEAA